MRMSEARVPFLSMATNSRYIRISFMFRGCLARDLHVQHKTSQRHLTFLGGMSQYKSTSSCLRMSRARASCFTEDVLNKLLQHLMFRRMSQAKRPFSNIRAISRPISTSHVLEDVSGETPIFNIKRLKTTPPNIPIF